jgi:lysophospholipase L1-like esterase
VKRENPKSLGVLGLIGVCALAAIVLGSCGNEPSRTRSVEPEPPLTSAPTPSPESASPLRIMPLGDSITQADARHDSYRRPLFFLLREAGHDVDFVGSQSDHHGGSPPRSDFDTDHEGHWGYRVDEILENAERWFRTHEPDVVVVHLGSNDVFQGQDIDETIAELRELLTALRIELPEARALVAQIVPTDNTAVNRRIRELNSRIDGLREEGFVEIVDQNTGFDASTLTYDGVHPNADGEIQMAERFRDALSPVLAALEDAS